MFDGARVRFDELGVSRVRPGHSPTLFGLVEDHIDGADQRVGEVHGRDIGREPAEFLKPPDHPLQALEHRLDVPIDQPTHARAAALAFVVHQSNEFGMAPHESYVCPDAGANPRDFVLRIVRQRLAIVEPIGDLAEGSIYCSLPQLLLVAEMVLEQPHRNACPLRDCACRGAVEPPLGKSVEGGLENALAGAAGRVPRPDLVVI